MSSSKPARPRGTKSLAAQTGISASQLLEWANRADLMRVPGVTAALADLLENAGVDTVKELATRNPENRMPEARRGRRLVGAAARWSGVGGGRERRQPSPTEATPLSTRKEPAGPTAGSLVSASDWRGSDRLKPESAGKRRLSASPGRGSGAARTGTAIRRCGTRRRRRPRRTPAGQGRPAGAQGWGRVCGPSLLLA